MQPAVDLAEVAEAQAAERKRMAGAQAAEQAKEIYATMQLGCEPLFQLFRKVSSDENSPGNLMDKKFQKMEAEQSRLSANMAADQLSGAGRAEPGTDLSPSPLRSNVFGLSGMAGDNSRNAVTPPRGGESDSDSASKGTDMR